MLAGAVLNEGLMMEPFVIRKITGAGGTVRYEAKPKAWKQSISAVTAREMRRMMLTTVTEGTAQRAFRRFEKNPILSRLQLGGKTGSLSGKNLREDRMVRGVRAQPGSPDRRGDRHRERPGLEDQALAAVPGHRGELLRPAAGPGGEREESGGSRAMTDDRKPGFRQRRYLVDKRFQFKYTAMVIVFSSIVFAALGYELYQKTVANTEILRIQHPDVQALVQGKDRQILYLLGGFFLLQVASLFVLGILITHRIAGPVFRVQRYLDEIAEKGELKPLNPARSRDEFHGFFESLSRVVAMFHSRLEARKIKTDELRTAIQEGRLEHIRSAFNELEKTS